MSFSLRAAAAAITALALTALFAAEALAQSSRTIYTHRAWTVQVVALDNGSINCMAQVRSGGRSFSIWAEPEGRMRLQWFNPSWEFGTDTADVVAQIDGRPTWNLRAADLYKNSVLFYLPTSDSGVRFVTEVARGNNIYLYNNRGQLQISFTLAGSMASIRELINCVDGLNSGGRNPFR